MKPVVMLAVALLGAVAMTDVQGKQAGQEEHGRACGFPVAQISVSRWDNLLLRTETALISEGTRRARVESMLGKPVRALGEDLVVYDNCRPNQDRAKHCRQLLVRYAQGRVTALYFVNEPMAAFVAANAQRKDMGLPAAPTAVAMAMAEP